MWVQQKLAAAAFKTFILSVYMMILYGNLETISAGGELKKKYSDIRVLSLFVF